MQCTLLIFHCISRSYAPSFYRLNRYLTLLSNNSWYPFSRLLITYTLITISHFRELSIALSKRKANLKITRNALWPLSKINTWQPSRAWNKKSVPLKTVLPLSAPGLSITKRPVEERKDSCCQLCMRYVHTYIVQPNTSIFYSNTYLSIPSLLPTPF